MTVGLRPIAELLEPFCGRISPAEALARDVADFAAGLDLFFRWRRNRVAARTNALLQLDIEPGDVLLRANRDLESLRSADPDSLIEVYLATPEATRARFREAGRRDREHAESITAATVEMLAAPRGLA